MKDKSESRQENGLDDMTVKELAIPLDECAVVDEHATLYDAVMALDEAQDRIAAERHPHRAILVTDGSGQVIGKIGQLAFLHGLEHRFDMSENLGTLKRAGVSKELISTLSDHARYLQYSIEDFCRSASGVKVKDVMHSVTESVDENTLLLDAIHRIVECQQLSLLVKRKEQVVGLLRLSDVFEAVTDQIKNMGSQM